jgi:hypothetical protein
MYLKSSSFGLWILWFDMVYSLRLSTGISEVFVKNGFGIRTFAEPGQTVSELFEPGLVYQKLRLLEQARSVGSRLDNPRAIRASAAGSPGVLLEHPPRAAFAHRDFVESPRARIFAGRCRSIKVANTTDGNRWSIR